MLPTVFVSHGSPMHAIDAGRAGAVWAELGRALPRPLAVLIASAHWETELPMLSTARQPQTIAQVTGGLSAIVGAYRVNEQAFADGLRFFRNDQFVEARRAFERADPAVRDAPTQFYIAYCYYRQGWGRLYHDNQL